MARKENESVSLPSDSNGSPGSQPKSSTTTDVEPSPVIQPTRLAAKRQRMQSQSQISCQEIETGNNTNVFSVSEVPIQNSGFTNILEKVAHGLNYKPERAISDPMRANIFLTAKGIYEKHGDITKDCLFGSDYYIISYWIGISKVVLDLKNKNLSVIDTNLLDSHYTVIKDAEKMKVNVKWLHSRLDEIKEAVKWAEEEKCLMDEMKRLVESDDEKTKELLLLKIDLEKLKSKIKAKEDELAGESAAIQELKTKIELQKRSRSSKLQHLSLMDGLV